MARTDDIDSEFANKFKHCVYGPQGSRLHYVIGGHGDPVLLVPGWPQTWYAWRHVMLLLAERFTLVAVDPPGPGDSDRPFAGYDTD
jgi:pimeloyl-ACP methyl ester carboxylesterase